MKHAGKGKTILVQSLHHYSATAFPTLWYLQFLSEACTDDPACGQMFDIKEFLSVFIGSCITFRTSK